ncbi:ferritin-like domain-containing protein [Melittangium boletus]|uniref:DUF2383 domain-containing protein n=1 Tax=Melittangium boletus DSM 14713 TaxID=1294270 RepID=A0A250I8K5_9BACT|nr:PA2169 family four-helix-bundle protein [Melittangium boletus]ATB27538.1 hypothetical protein MEBOL_000981 [Melittangium boletus DSM 14713]
MANANADVETLNSFLRGELSAVETYRQAIDHVENERIRDQLQDCMQDHEQRVSSIRERITKLGGTPSDSSGLWGTFAQLVQAGADALGEKAAVQALEQGEDRGLADYQRDIDKLHGDARRFGRMVLLPAQKQTHERVRLLKKTYH